MKSREKILVLAAGILLVSFAGYGAVKKALIDPARRADQKARALEIDKQVLETDNRREASCRKRLDALAARTFQGDEKTVREKVRARLTRLMEQAGLSTERFSSQPLQGSKIRHKGKETDRSVGQSVTIRGKTSHVISFLYLLNEDPFLHRIDDVALSPDPKTGKMDLQLKYYTLVLAAPPGRAAATTGPATEPAVTLDGERRDRYDMIVRRDAFRPYVPRPKVVVERPRERTGREDPPPPSVDRESQLRIVGLPTLFGVPEVNVRDSSLGETRTKTLKIGEKLGKGTIVMIDYRPIPRRDDPKKTSPSRAILRIGTDYWAVENGQTVADKHRMKASELPAALRKDATTAPAAEVSRSGSET